MCKSIIELPNDLSQKLNKNILLIGAGFSKNYEGFLANEISTRLFNSTEITSEIKSKIARAENSNYEDVYNSLAEEGKEIYEKLLITIFKDMDKFMAKRVGSVNSNLEKFINIFSNQNLYNFIFTLNQDLLIERLYLKMGQPKQGRYKSNEEIKNNLESLINLNYPYTNYSLPNVIRYKANSNGSIQGNELYVFDDFIQVIKFENKNFPIAGRTNYVKIHGSANWSHSEGSNIHITGKDKNQRMLKFNVLRSCFDIFKKIFTFNGLKIIIVGYSFNDDHINNVLLETIQNNSKLFVIDPRKFDEFKALLKIKFSDKSSLFIDGIENYLPYTLNDFLSFDDGSLLQDFIQKIS